MARIKNDAYYTQDKLALAICQRLSLLGINPKTILEPACGMGAFVKAARQTWTKSLIVAVDINPIATDVSLKHGADASVLPKQFDGFDLVLGNPPYNQAEEFVVRGFDQMKHEGYMALLLRLSFLGSRKRIQVCYKGKGLRYLIPIVPRPSFTPDGKSDYSEYAVFCWQKDYGGFAHMLDHLEWK